MRWVSFPRVCMKGLSRSLERLKKSKAIVTARFMLRLFIMPFTTLT